MLFGQRGFKTPRSSMTHTNTHVHKLTSQVDPNVPSAKTIELYDLSPQRMVGLPVSASRVICDQRGRVTQSDTEAIEHS